MKYCSKVEILTDNRASTDCFRSRILLGVYKMPRLQYSNVLVDTVIDLKIFYIQVFLLNEEFMGAYSREYLVWARGRELDGV